MTKWIFLASALLLLFLCSLYGANLSVQVARADNGGGACDNGPNAGAVPAPAAAAGFTRCALNADFTQVGGFFGNVATFMDGCGGTGNNLFQAYYAYSGVQVPCNRITIEQGRGSQVLHLRYQPGDSAGTDYPARPLEFAYPTLMHGGAVESGWPQPTGAGALNGFPQEMYAEITFRTTKASLNTGQPGQNIPFSWWQMGASGQPSSSTVEVDYIEINSDSNGGSGWLNATGMREWCSVSNCAFPDTQIVSYADYTRYHRFGVLVKSDEQTFFFKCFYIDDALQGCQILSPVDPAAFKTRDNSFNYLVVWAGNNGLESNNPTDIYIKSARVWECPSYQTTTCPTP